LIHDLGSPIEKLFLSFDDVPVGIASLAEVHRYSLLIISRAQLLDGTVVAVKIQHPELDSLAPLDIRVSR
jgi:aarF domain-containing kinase